MGKWIYSTTDALNRHTKPFFYKIHIYSYKALNWNASCRSHRLASKIPVPGFRYLPPGYWSRVSKILPKQNRPLTL